VSALAGPDAGPGSAVFPAAGETRHPAAGSDWASWRALLLTHPPPCRERHTRTEHVAYLARERWILLWLAQKTPREPHPRRKSCRAIPDHSQRLMAWSPNLYNRAADCQSHLLVVIPQSLQPSLLGTVSGP
jgi:hypothetical protein